MLVEQFVRGREIDVAVIEHPDGRIECLPPLEIVVADGDIFDADAKYDREPDFRIPAAVDAALLAALESAALATFRAARLPAGSPASTSSPPTAGCCSTR